jgi:hypothetical protein
MHAPFLLLAQLNSEWLLSQTLIRGQASAQPLFAACLIGQTGILTAVAAVQTERNLSFGFARTPAIASDEKPTASRIRNQETSVNSG